MIYTWAELNAKLRSMKNESAVLELFRQQKAAKASARWLGRIHERYRRLRVQREKRELSRQ